MSSAKTEDELRIPISKNRILRHVLCEITKKLWTETQKDYFMLKSE